MENTSPTVKRRGVAAGATWLFLAGQVERVLGVASIGVLARLLSPEDFGLVGTATAVAALVEIVGAFGFDWALVRLRDPTRDHYDTAWTLQIITGVMLGLMIALIAFPIAEFYGNVRVGPILLGISAYVAIGSATNTGVVEFRRAMDFSVDFKMRLASKLSGAAVAIFVAFEFRSYWALIMGIGASRLSSVVYSYICCAFRPRFSFRSTGDLLSFSWWVLLCKVIDSLSERFAQLYIAHFSGPKSVGYYNMAAEMSSIATSEIAAPINRAMFTRYSESSGDVALVTAGFRKASGIIWMVGVPACFGIVACASDMVAVLLGSQWGDAVPVFRVLALANLFHIMAANSHYVYWGLNRARFVTALSFATSGVFIAASICIAREYGVLGVAFAQVFSAILGFAVNYAMLFRTLSLSMMDVVRDQWRTFVASMIMAAAVWAIGIWLTDGRFGPALRLGVLVPVGVMIYVITLVFLWWLQGYPQGPEREASKMLVAYTENRRLPGFLDRLLGSLKRLTH